MAVIVRETTSSYKQRLTNGSRGGEVSTVPIVRRRALAIIDLPARRIVATLDKSDVFGTVWANEKGTRLLVSERGVVHEYAAITAGPDPTLEVVNSLEFSEPSFVLNLLPTPDGTLIAGLGKRLSQSGVRKVCVFPADLSELRCAEFWVAVPNLGSWLDSQTLRLQADAPPRMVDVVVQSDGLVIQESNDIRIGKSLRISGGRSYILDSEQRLIMKTPRGTEQIIASNVEDAVAVDDELFVVIDTDSRLFAYANDGRVLHEEHAIHADRILGVRASANHRVWILSTEMDIYELQVENMAVSVSSDPWPISLRAIVSEHDW